MAQIPITTNPEFFGFLFAQMDGATLELITLDPGQAIAVDADLATITAAEGNVGNYNRPSLTLSTSGAFDSGSNAYAAPPIQFQIDANATVDISFNQIAVTIAKGGTTAVIGVSPVQALTTIAANSSPYLADIAITAQSQN